MVCYALCEQLAPGGIIFVGADRVVEGKQKLGFVLRYGNIAVPA